jgi:hypothetical protein
MAATTAMVCCDEEMSALAQAERGGNSVTVWQCDNCGRVDSDGICPDPVEEAKIPMFLELRQEAFRRAGMEVEPAGVIFDTWENRVIFSFAAD